jgi:hypothetical protein
MGRRRDFISSSNHPRSSDVPARSATWTLVTLSAARHQHRTGRDPHHGISVDFPKSGPWRLPDGKPGATSCPPLRSTLKRPATCSTTNVPRVRGFTDAELRSRQPIPRHRAWRCLQRFCREVLRPDQGSAMIPAGARSRERSRPDAPVITGGGHRASFRGIDTTVPLGAPPD